MKNNIKLWVFLLLIGGLLYAAISGVIHNNRSNRIISDLRADHERIIDALANAESRVADLTGLTREFEQRNNELEFQLNLSLERVRELRNDNKRLKNFIESGIESAGDITGTSQRIRESLERAWGIIEYYEDRGGD